MTAILAYSIVLALLLTAAVLVWRIIRQEEAAARIYSCDLCAGALRTAVVYLPTRDGTRRPYCLDCAEVVQAGRYPSTEVA